MPSICAGIGKSIARKLAGQGLNVVLVALQDELLDGTTRELKKAFPKILLRKVRGRSLSFKNNAQLRLWPLPPPPPPFAFPASRWHSARTLYGLATVRQVGVNPEKPAISGGGEEADGRHETHMDSTQTDTFSMLGGGQPG